MLLLPLAATASAEDPANHSARQAVPRFEIYSGFNATENSWFSHMGAAWAPFGSIHDPGLRLRLLGGYGGYDYMGTLLVNGVFHPAAFHGKSALGEAMLGYAFVLDPLYLKLYAGVAWDEHRLTPDDPDNPVKGHTFNAKLQAEAWLNLGSSGWLSADASYGWGFRKYAAKLKLGYKIMPFLSVGPEVGARGNEHYDGALYGAFLRLDGALGEFTLSGGVAGDYEEPASVYGALSYSAKF